MLFGFELFKYSIGLHSIELAQSLFYLGGQLEAKGTCDTEIRRRMATAGEAVNRLCKSVFKRHDVMLDLKQTIQHLCSVYCLW